MSADIVPFEDRDPDGPDAWLAEYRRAERRVNVAKAELDEARKARGRLKTRILATPPGGLNPGVASAAYWEEELAVEIVAHLVGAKRHAEDLVRLVGGPSYTCLARNHEFTAPSRTWVEGRRDCLVCTQEDQDRRREERHNRGPDPRAARLVELRTMPYREYLQTPEWQATRKDALRRAGYRCQVCGATGFKLNVHHNTYERRGEEYARDLIVLCYPCHNAHHDGGRR